MTLFACLKVLLQKQFIKTIIRHKTPQESIAIEQYFPEVFYENLVTMLHLYLFLCLCCLYFNYR